MTRRLIPFCNSKVSTEHHNTNPFPGLQIKPQVPGSNIPDNSWDLIYKLGDQESEKKIQLTLPELFQFCSAGNNGK